MVLDKSPERILDNDLTHIKKEFEKNLPNILLFSEPFEKSSFLDKLITSVEDSIIFVDMDLLYTGYVESGMTRTVSYTHLTLPTKRKV